jgi:predicted secreted hydrolase
MPYEANNLLPMKLSFLQLISIPIVIAILFGVVLFSETEPELESTVSVAEAMGGGNQEGYLQATGPRDFVFPDDHGAHPGYKTEWWYYTGNVFTAEGRQFGYQFTIFRNQLSPPTEISTGIGDSTETGDSSEHETPTDSIDPKKSSEDDWSTDQLYLAHFAISDVAEADHVFEERFSRGAAGLAGAEIDPYRVWLENWSIERLPNSGENDQSFPMRLHGEMSDGTAIDLKLQPEKPLIFHGDQGYDQKGFDSGNASYYISFTRMETQGEIVKDGKVYHVTGNSWMDHEWSTSALDSGQTGWDWFSIQLSNGYDLMYYQIRNADASQQPQTTGTLVDPLGNTIDLEELEVMLDILEYWQSPHSGSRYPKRWTLKMPELDIYLELGTLFDDQEMRVSVQYFEGNLGVSGQMRGKEVSGTGFIEMTGYEQD